MFVVEGITPVNIARTAREANGRFRSFQGELNAIWRRYADEHYLQPARRKLRAEIAATGRIQRPTRHLERALVDVTEMTTLRPVGGGITIDPEPYLDETPAASYWRYVEQGREGFTLAVPGGRRGVVGVFMPSETRPGAGRGDTVFMPGAGSGLLVNVGPQRAYRFLETGRESFGRAVRGDILRRDVIAAGQRAGVSVTTSGRTPRRITT